MRRTVLNAAALLAAVALVIGCGDEKAKVPTKLDQPIPKVAAPAGGGGEAAPKNRVGAAATKKPAQPNTKVD
jgi:hypothetical protein